MICVAVMICAPFEVLVSCQADPAIEDKQADLVSFAKPFIANPDLVRRFREGLPLASSSAETYYQGGPQGYVDYPAAP